MEKLLTTTAGYVYVQNNAFTVYQHMNDVELQELETWLDYIDAQNDEIEHDTWFANAVWTHH